jgi:hypothetical protein
MQGHPRVYMWVIYFLPGLSLTRGLTQLVQRAEKGDRRVWQKR